MRQTSKFAGQLALVVLTVLAGALAGCAGQTAPQARGEGQLLVCGENQIIAIDVAAARKDPAAVLWSWRPEDSPEIIADHRTRFRAMDECKPVMGGSAVLACSSSSGGVALIRRADKKCLFYAKGRNAHTADLIMPTNAWPLTFPILAVALSGDKGKLALFRLDDSQLDPEPAWTMPLPWAHGVIWDRQREVLWVLGGTELLKLAVQTGRELSARELARYKLPVEEGHDLSVWDSANLAVTAGQAVLLFNIDTGQFQPHPLLGTKENVKSLDRRAGRVVYIQGQPTFSNVLHFADAPDLVLPKKEWYKARWLANGPQ